MTNVIISYVKEIRFWSSYLPTFLINVIKYRVFFWRLPIEFIRAWDANIDVQIALDFFSIITYIADYYSKDDSGTSDLIKQGMAECTSQVVKER